MTPKQRILANELAAKEIRAMVSGTLFEMASEAALHEFVMNQNSSLDGASAIAERFQLEGAKRFLAGLQRIADAPQRGAPPPQSGQLDHEMKLPEKK